MPLHKWPTTPHGSTDPLRRRRLVERTGWSGFLWSCFLQTLTLMSKEWLCLRADDLLHLVTIGIIDLLKKSNCVFTKHAQDKNRDTIEK